ncbi:ParA family protein [Geoglobus sp.]
MIVGIHSFKGGTGKTFLATNLSYILSKKFKVCLIELDLKAPSLSNYFEHDKYVNDLLVNGGRVKDFIYQVNDYLWVLLASPEIQHIRRGIARKDHEYLQILTRLEGVINELKKIGYSFIVLDNSPGLDYMAVNSMLLSDIILFVVRPEMDDLKGLDMLFSVSKNIERPKYVIVNRVVRDIELDYPVLGEIPCSCDVTADLPFFVSLNPEHIISKKISSIAGKLVELERVRSSD